MLIEEAKLSEQITKQHGVIGMLGEKVHHRLWLKTPAPRSDACVSDPRARAPQTKLKTKPSPRIGIDRDKAFRKTRLKPRRFRQTMSRTRPDEQQLLFARTPLRQPLLERLPKRCPQT